MKVTLALPREGKKPGDSIEVDDAVGRQLIADGHAKPFDPKERPEKPAPAPEIGAYVQSTPESGPLATTTADAPSAAEPKEA